MVLGSISSMFSPVKKMLTGQSRNNSLMEEQDGDSRSNFEEEEEEDRSTTTDTESSASPKKKTPQTPSASQNRLKTKSSKPSDWKRYTPPEANDFDAFFHKKGAAAGDPRKNPNSTPYVPSGKKIDWDNIPNMPQLQPPQMQTRLPQVAIDAVEHELSGFKVQELDGGIQAQSTPYPSRRCSINAQEKKKSSQKRMMADDLKTPTSRAPDNKEGSKTAPQLRRTTRMYSESPAELCSVNEKRETHSSWDDNNEEMDLSCRWNPTTVPKTDKYPDTPRSTERSMATLLQGFQSSLFGTHRCFSWYDSTSFSPLDSSEERMIAAANNKGQKVPEKMLPDTPKAKVVEEEIDEEDYDDESSEGEPEQESGSEYEGSESEEDDSEESVERKIPKTPSKDQGLCSDEETEVEVSVREEQVISADGDYETARDGSEEKPGTEEDEQDEFGPNIDADEDIADVSSGDVVDDSDMADVENTGNGADTDKAKQQQLPPKSKTATPKRQKRKRKNSDEAYKPGSSDDEESEEEFSDLEPSPKRQNASPKKIAVATEVHMFEDGNNSPADLQVAKVVEETQEDGGESAVEEVAENPETALKARNQQVKRTLSTHAHQWPIGIMPPSGSEIPKASIHFLPENDTASRNSETAVSNLRHVRTFQPKRAASAKYGDFSYVYRPSRLQALRSTNLVSPSLLPQLRPLEVKKEEDIVISQDDTTESARDTLEAGLRRGIINTLTFPSNVQLVQPGVRYFFKCCLCGAVSEIKLRFYHEEIIWGDQQCMHCYSHECCENCARFESATGDSGEDEDVGYEMALRSAARAALKRPSMIKANEIKMSMNLRSEEALRKTAGGGIRKVNWQGRKKQVENRKRTLAKRFKDDKLAI